ncbi:tyrosinase [Lactarius quietus]|nr:tyrosinase [Lactarius quietus]
MTHLVITGASGGIQQGAAAPNRIEINDFVKSKKSFSLFIQALSELHSTPQNDSTSHFSIAGIHGLPYTPWQGAGGPHAVEGSQWGGYCTHGSVLFPCWHRPYVCLYEQVMQHYALAIANTYEVDKELWVNTAQNLRLPYWDWATNCVPPREVISQETVNIVTPDGQTTSVENPLFKYTFNPVDTSFPPPYSYWPTTIRHPDDADSANATTDVQGLIDDLSSIQDDITTSTYNLLTRVTAWPGFSNHTPGDGGNTSNSLEAIHDEIHGYIAGHMGDPAVAAFDHLFFLHHANVDRMVCLWTALNPSMWVSTGPAEGGTYTISGNASVGSSTSLTPFWRSQTDFWVSSEITTTQTFQYSYPEFNNLSSDPAAIRDAIGNYINQQYGRSFVAPAPVALTSGTSTTAPVTSGSSATAPVAPAPASTAAGYIYPYASRSDGTYTAAKADPRQGATEVRQDWTIRIRFKKFELGQSCTVLIFLGKVPRDVSRWRTSPTFVGAHVSFVNSVTDQCANCRDQAEMVAEGFVHVNNAIAKSGCPSFEPDVVIPYLRENLDWRVQATDRTAVELDRFPSLEVTVVAVPLTHAPGAIFPIAGHPQYHHHITHGRPGGSRHQLHAKT